MATSGVNSSSDGEALGGSDDRVLKQGSFYTSTDDGNAYILLDSTKRGLEPRERSIDGKTGIEADKGIIYDMDGIRHTVPIRWYYAKDTHEISEVTGHADSIEKIYTKLREITCPSDD